jgi:hypothetical protein
MNALNLLLFSAEAHRSYPNSDLGCACPQLSVEAKLIITLTFIAYCRTPRRVHQLRIVGNYYAWDAGIVIRAVLFYLCSESALRLLPPAFLGSSTLLSSEPSHFALPPEYCGRLAE